MLNLITPNIIIESICAFSAFVYLMKDKSWIWRSFMLYMVYLTINEVFGRYISLYGNGDNSWLYNISLIFEIGIVNLMFSHLLKKYAKSQRWIITGLALTSLMYGIDIYLQGFQIYTSNTRSLFSILMVVYALSYFYLLLKEEDYVVLQRYAPFWWVVGVLFYYSGSIISNLSFMKVDLYVFDKYPLRYVIFIVLNLILYAPWSYSFYCRYHQHKI